MANTWGRRLRLSIFGESHGAAVGIVMDGLPPGFSVDWDAVRHQMDRRAPGKGELVSQRAEPDEWELLSGYFNGHTTGTPLAAIIRNKDAVSKEYCPDILRPGHADLSALYKYKGYADYRGGGHFSGRLTAPLVFAGAIARQLLTQRGVRIGARIAAIGGVSDGPLDPEAVIEASLRPFPAASEEIARRMREEIRGARDASDSVGGVIECVAVGLPPGVGEPFFGSLESVVAAMLFSVPAVKGVEFGDGFALGKMRGSAANDGMRYEEGGIRLDTNHNGGITGGISNGAPLVVRAAVKPTPTIAAAQSTVDTAKKQTVRTGFHGRHDPCILLRAVPVIEAAVALCLLDTIEE